MKDTLWVYASEISQYLFCPRKIAISLIYPYEISNKDMFLGETRHKIIENINDNEDKIINSIKTKNIEEIKKLYENYITKYILNYFKIKKNILKKYSIDLNDYKLIKEQLNKIIEYRSNKVFEFIIKNKIKDFNNLYNEIKPKFINEISIENRELKLKGRIDLVEFYDDDLFYEIKNKKNQFQRIIKNKIDNEKNKEEINNKLIPVEIKTSNKRINRPFKSHKYQLFAYLMMCKINKGKLFYVAEQNKTFDVYLNPFAIKEIKQIIKEIIKIKQGFLPEISTEKSYICNYCIFKDFCNKVNEKYYQDKLEEYKK